MSDASMRWPEPPSNWPESLGRAASRDVHVWAARLDLSAAELTRLAATLSGEELERAARFHFERHRNRFIAARGVLRTVLARYLQTDPAEIPFAYGPFGKPALAAVGGAGLDFNLAHSDDLALLAVTRAGVVGVDVERVRPIQDTAELVARFFSARENAAFQQLRREQQPTAFFNLWTRKEAFLKATGEGIGRLLNLVEVEFLPGKPARLHELPAHLAGGQSWSLFELAPAEEFVGALAVASEKTALNCWRWEGVA